MASVQERLAARAAAAVERHGDQGEAVAGGGGDFTPPPAGRARARLVGYIETGPQKDRKFPDKKPANKFRLVFALFGKNSAQESWAREDGKPMLITSRPYLVSRSEKANALKLFKRMCPKGDAQHFIGLLDRTFTLEIVHEAQPAKEAGKPDVVFANIKEETIQEAVKPILDEDDNVVGYEPVKVPAAPEDYFKVFEWDVLEKADFEALSEAQKKTVRSAVGFKESAWFALVGGGNPAATDKPEDEPGLPGLDDEDDTPAVAAKNGQAADDGKPPFKPDPVVEVDEDDMPPL
ncbi:hypothetical protein HOS18_gp01 [Aeromonas phage CF7]|uniref:Uncharacterized protein n=1 Tax=Aeromonas phage CF7 TaxID=2507411 RepID=A0A286NMQ2_9CAUD|nr:hypothetical protein HOS18_gp01 [Aeromonas phage CF7]ASZ71947.1 hypothetical protein CF7_01 [Aeromonas phage CF7]